MSTAWLYWGLGAVFAAVGIAFWLASSEDTMALMAGCTMTWSMLFLLVSRSIYKAERQAQ